MTKPINNENQILENYNDKNILNLQKNMLVSSLINIKLSQSIILSKSSKDRAERLASERKEVASEQFRKRAQLVV